MVSAEAQHSRAQSTAERSRAQQSAAERSRDNNIPDLKAKTGAPDLPDPKAEREQEQEHRQPEPGAEPEQSTSYARERRPGRAAGCLPKHTSGQCQCFRATLQGSPDIERWGRTSCRRSSASSTRAAAAAAAAAAASRAAARRQPQQQQQQRGARRDDTAAAAAGCTAPSVEQARWRRCQPRSATTARAAGAQRGRGGPVLVAAPGSPAREGGTRDEVGDGCPAARSKV